MATEVAATAAKTFKGVMLCERPANGDMKIADGGAKYRPFLPTSSSAANEQLGLTPAYKVGREAYQRCLYLGNITYIYIYIYSSH